MNFPKNPEGIPINIKSPYQEVLSMRLKKKTPKEEKLKKRPLTHQHQILSFGAIA